MDAEPELKADCARCAALCCMAHAFDESADFAFDKAAGEPCRHLDARHGCAIHAAKVEIGFRGCVVYDCYGAGQWVTQAMFGGRSWRDDPALTEAMAAALAPARRLHEQLLLLRAAGGLPLTAAEAEGLAALNAELRALRDKAAADQNLTHAMVRPLEPRIQAFLAGLRGHVAGR